ncbi:MAG TPA: hypothetical protein VGQ11_01815, partial [Candidatus Acidoferrales bacterium]|nr:hypothetical protein [Candidatus Acidoferrales bacterium]
MKINASRIRKRVAAGMLILVVQLSLQAAGAEAQPHARSWKVIDSGQRLTIAGGQLVSTSPDTDPEYIPLSAIRFLEKETLVRKPARKAIRELSGQYEVNWDDFNALVAQDPRVAMFAPVLPALQPLMVLSVQSPLAPFRNVQVNHHFVHV